MNRVPRHRLIRLLEVMPDDSRWRSRTDVVDGMNRLYVREGGQLSQDAYRQRRKRLATGEGAGAHETVLLKKLIQMLARDGFLERRGEQESQLVRWVPGKTTELPMAKLTGELGSNAAA